ncbi:MULTISPECIES: 1-phosphofructokinase family hexose kinase [Sphingobacterium]|uniref:Phosphofructokinase n=1 Tax=Sphingobacterium athyrii TaxID=2152717 RepID=A0A363NY04_9SPHI|nr:MULTISPECIES: 1-phosphofructokinase family hexose kinase [Sphingobacterium]PUV25617.1 phosphofructokinase [Sphingobacterium athyrii]QIH33617.1 1-phosphofructokinase family hexose kinase [Sphingobacterium sp. DR205]
MKKTVLTITLNPSVDKSTSVQNIVPEKKLRCDRPKYEAGGGGINVSRALKRLDIPSDALFTSGGKTGSMLENLLKKEDLDILPVHLGSETRENFIVVDKTTNQQYRFGFPGEAFSKNEQDEILALIDQISPAPDFVVISGSLPGDVPADFIGLLINKYKAKGSKVIVDTSGDALKVALKEGVFLLKPNAGELAALVGKEELENADLDHAAQQIIMQGQANIVVVSLGAQGAVLYTATEKIQMVPPLVKIRSTVGAGDSMVAGMVSVLVNQGTTEEILRMGIACGSATTMAEGTALFQKKDVDRLYNEVRKQ